MSDVVDCTGPAHISVFAKTARNLISKSWFGTNDPYLKMWTNTTRSKPQQSNTHKDGGDIALWRENFELTVRDAMTEFLYMEVINDKNQKLIGRVRVLCAEIPDGDGVESWFKIYDDKGKLGGELQVTLKRRHDETVDGTINRPGQGMASFWQKSQTAAISSARGVAAFAGKAPIHGSAPPTRSDLSASAGSSKWGTATTAAVAMNYMAAGAGPSAVAGPPPATAAPVASDGAALPMPPPLPTAAPIGASAAIGYGNSFDSATSEDSGPAFGSTGYCKQETRGGALAMAALAASRMKAKAVEASQRLRAEAEARAAEEAERSRLAYEAREAERARQVEIQAQMRRDEALAQQLRNERDAAERQRQRDLAQQNSPYGNNYGQPAPMPAGFTGRAPAVAARGLPAGFGGGGGYGASNPNALPAGFGGGGGGGYNPNALPAGFGGPPRPNGVSASASEALPPFWEELKTGDGRTYYVNHQDRTTHWVRPK